MTTPLTPAELELVIRRIGDSERELARLRERGPWDNPKAEEFMTGMSHEAKVARIERTLGVLRPLVRS